MVAHMLFHDVTCCINPLLSCFHVNTTYFLNILCTLVATCMILGRLERSSVATLVLNLLSIQANLLLLHFWLLLHLVGNSHEISMHLGIKANLHHMTYYKCVNYDKCVDYLNVQTQLGSHSQNEVHFDEQFVRSN